MHNGALPSSSNRDWDGELSYLSREDFVTRVRHGWDIINRDGGEDGLLCTMLELREIVANAELPAQRRDPHYAYVLENWERLAENGIDGRINRAVRTLF